MIEFKSKRNIFSKQPHTSRASHIVVLLGLLIAGFYIILGNQRGEITPLFPTPSAPTRVPRSYAYEGETQFLAGNLSSAIEAYQKAIAMAPNDYATIAELARIQVYYSDLATNNTERYNRLLAAKENIDKATALASDDVFVLTVRSLVYEWNSPSDYAGDKTEEYLLEAEQAVTRATQLDPNNGLAFAYQAELLVDQQKWTQAQDSIARAIEKDKTQMDIFRISGKVQESIGDYPGAIEEYLKAVALAPNFTPLYMQIGLNYDALGRKAANTDVQKQNFELALSYYAQAVSINQQLGVQDPKPYLNLANTYTQEGEFFAAALNVRTALDMRPDDANIYGRLGLVYHRARNYESAIPAFQCVVEGCDASVSCEVRQCNEEVDTPIVIEGQPLRSDTVDFYYLYGSVLAGMHRPGLDYCERAMKVFSELHDVYGTDADVMAIIAPSEEICRGYGFNLP